MDDGEPVARIYEIDGEDFLTLEQFFDEVSRVLIPGVYWGRNLDAFNDILRGGFGTPDDGFTLRWRHHEASRRNLGHNETARQLQIRLGRCHPTNRAAVAAQLAEAQERTGPTVFDWLVEIIRDHGPGGTQAADRVLLQLTD